ncbi:MAG TPA: thrombospondin type 3 repeat-containing protein, partial [Solirubrobacterales bacterium]|nr:thrombospondin type 3 repeat-containing protein [Solirubrobacterales bacterium]
TMAGIGARWEPRQSALGRAFVDATLGAAFTRDKAAFAFDVGGGFEFDVPTAPGLSLGPYLRYGQVVNPASLSNDDGRAWSVGVSASFHIGRYQVAVAAEKAHAPGQGRPVRPFVFRIQDSDRDGVFDDSDQCPSVPAGRHPDAYRPGCPENDEDKDGVVDSDDVCPMTPAGDHPDPKRAGCPFSDRDGDGIADLDDHCPDKAGPATQDPATNGCPPARQHAEPPAEREPAPTTDLPAPNRTPKHGLTRKPAP